MTTTKQEKATATIVRIGTLSKDELKALLTLEMGEDLVALWQTYGAVLGDKLTEDSDEITLGDVVKFLTHACLMGYLVRAAEGPKAEFQRPVGSTLN